MTNEWKMMMRKINIRKIWNRKKKIIWCHFFLVRNSSKLKLQACISFYSSELEKSIIFQFTDVIKLRIIKLVKHLNSYCVLRKKKLSLVTSIHFRMVTTVYNLWFRYLIMHSCLFVLIQTNIWTQRYINTIKIKISLYMYHVIKLGLLWRNQAIRQWTRAPMNISNGTDLFAVF